MKTKQPTLTTLEGQPAGLYLCRAVGTSGDVGRWDGKSLKTILGWPMEGYTSFTRLYDAAEVERLRQVSDAATTAMDEFGVTVQSLQQQLAAKDQQIAAIQAVLRDVPELNCGPGRFTSNARWRERQAAALNETQPPTGKE